jgi:hypothetical protein
MVGAAEVVMTLGITGDAPIELRVEFLEKRKLAQSECNGQRIFFDASVEAWSHAYNIRYGEKHEPALCFVFVPGKERHIRALHYEDRRWVFRDHRDADSLPREYVSSINGLIEISKRMDASEIEPPRKD